MVVIVWWLVLQLPMRSMPITTKVVCLNPAHGEVYSIHYVINFVQWLAVGRWISPGKPVSSTNKIDHHDITEILLKVALNTITLTIAHTISCAITCQAEEEFQIPVFKCECPAGNTPSSPTHTHKTQQNHFLQAHFTFYQWEVNLTHSIQLFL